jgi:hypothetical protein
MSAPLGSTTVAAAFGRLQQLGLEADIVPIVCDQSLPISPESKIRSLGKTPSVINHRGEVHGLAGWTSRMTTAQEVAAWAKDERYSAGIQTRRVRAADIDVEDPTLANQIAKLFEEELGIQLPRRGRRNSSKLLLPFMLKGRLKKRSFRTAGGIVELLADGQQFVVAGTHPSGVQYAWQAGLPSEIPTVTLEAFEKAWSAIAQRFGNEPPLAASKRSFEKVTDKRLPWLLRHWEHHGFGSGGKLFIRCPFKDGHSIDSGQTECAYLPAGTQGYQIGHYKCLHASCSGRSDADFDVAVGFIQQAPAGLERDAKGRLLSSVSNLEIALTADAWTGCLVAMDEFTADIMIFRDGGSWERFQDHHRTELRIELERKGFRPIQTQDLRECVRLVARKNAFDSAQRWLNSLEWDAQPRIQRFLIDYFQCEDTPYAQTLGMYWWTAHAARILYPGCQVDMVPILVSSEGKHKSTALQAVAPSFDQYAEVDLHHRDADLARLMRGKLIGEIAELRGLRSRSSEAIKAYITRREEEWTPKYVEATTRFKRRSVLVGTTNEDSFLNDATGDRRWLPIEVGNADPQRIAADRDQLWAEAKSVVIDRCIEGDDPVAWEPVSSLAQEQRVQYRCEDPWIGILAEWLDSEAGREIAKNGVSMNHLLEWVFRLAPGQQTPVMMSRGAKSARALGGVEERRRVGNGRPRMWTFRSRP